MNLNLPTSRGRFGRFGGYSSLGSLGDCQSLPGSAFCRDNNTGSIVDCNSTPCKTGGGGNLSSDVGSWSSNVPVTNPQYSNIPIGGFTGDFQVMTLDSFLSQVLASKESPFMANVIARGADTAANQAADFQAQADSYCAINGALPDCGQKSSLVAKYRNLYMQWASGQKASTYQSQDSGTIANPINTLTNTAPVYTPVVQAPSTNVLSPPQTGNPTGDKKNVTGDQSTNNQSTDNSTDGITAWIKQNWVLIAAGVAAVVFLPSMMGRH